MEVLQVVIGGELLCLVLLYLAHRLHVGLVASNVDDNVFVGVLLELARPLFDLSNPPPYLVEGLGRSNVVYDDGSVGISVVDGSYGVVFLLAGCVLRSESEVTHMASLITLLLERVTFF